MNLHTVDQSDQRGKMVRCLLSICKDGTIQLDGDGNMLGAVKTIIVASLKCVNKPDMLAAAVPGKYIDWDYVDAQKSRGLQNILGDSVGWLQLLHFVSFERPTDVSLVDVLHEYPLLGCIHSPLKQCMSQVYCIV